MLAWLLVTAGVTFMVFLSQSQGLPTSRSTGTLFNPWPTLGLDVNAVGA
jgi:hypothetical protein